MPGYKDVCFAVSGEGVQERHTLIEITSYFHHFVAPCVKRGLKIAFSQIKKSSNFCY